MKPSAKLMARLAISISNLSWQQAEKELRYAVELNPNSPGESRDACLVLFLEWPARRGLDQSGKNVAA
jgi:hypothetical protein